MSALASVVVAVNPHDEPMRPVLDAWAVQASAGDYEVIVVDNGSRDGVREACDAHRDAFPSTPVRVLDVDTVGRAATNNAGTRASRGELLLFVADDFRPARTLVAAHRRFHALGSADAVGVGAGYFRTGRDDDPFRRWLEGSGQNFGIAFPLAGVDWRAGFFYVGNASMSRTTFDAVGPFDERFRHDLFDDFEWSMRLRAKGFRTHYVPRAFAWHDHDVSLDERLRAMRRLGEAARICEGDWQGPRPWESLAGYEVETIEGELRAERSKAEGAATIANNARRWQLELTLAFLRGFHPA